MSKFCTNCGETLKEKDNLCPKCGAFCETEIIVEKNVSNNKNGLSTAGMILGIIAASWSFLALLSLFDLEGTLTEMLSSYSNLFTNVMPLLVSFGIGYTLFSLLPSLVGLPLSIVGVVKLKNGRGTAGIILNTIALVLSICMIVYIVILGSNLVVR